MIFVVSHSEPLQFQLIVKYRMYWIILYKRPARKMGNFHLNICLTSFLFFDSINIHCTRGFIFNYLHPPYSQVQLSTCPHLPSSTWKMIHIVENSKYLSLTILTFQLCRMFSSDMSSFLHSQKASAPSVRHKPEAQEIY